MGIISPWDQLFHYTYCTYGTADFCSGMYLPNELTDDIKMMLATFLLSIIVSTHALGRVESQSSRTLLKSLVFPLSSSQAWSSSSLQTLSDGVPATVPSYSESEAQFKKTREFLASQLEWQVPTRKDRNYVALLAGIMGMGESMANGLSFEAAYAQWPGFVNLARQFPVQARQIIRLKFQGSVQRTQLIRDLLNQISGSGTSQSCDRIIETRIRNDARLQPQAALLIEIGYLAQGVNEPKYESSQWKSFLTEWAKVAASNSMEEYLASHREELRPIIEQEGVVFRMANCMNWYGGV